MWELLFPTLKNKKEKSNKYTLNHQQNKECLFQLIVINFYNWFLTFLFPLFFALSKNSHIISYLYSTSKQKTKPAFSYKSPKMNYLKNINKIYWNYISFEI